MAGLKLGGHIARRAFDRWRAVASVLVGASILPLGIAVVVESHDPYCAGCHLPPETTYVERAAASEPIDLAAAHAHGQAASRVRCVDCHGGPGIAGRWRSLGIGARDAAAWIRGQYVVVGSEYAPLGEVKHPIDDAVCRACHAEATADTGFENHFHHKLQAPGVPPDLRCTTCHAAHRPRPGVAAYLTDADTAFGCRRCHDVMGGPEASISPTRQAGPGAGRGGTQALLLPLPVRLLRESRHRGGVPASSMPMLDIQCSVP